MSDTTDVNPAARRSAVGARRPFYRRRKSCPFSGPNAPKIDYKDVRLLSRFLSERGKTPRLRPADPDRRGAECQRLENVGAAPDSPIDEYRNSAAHCAHDFGQAVHGRS